MSVLETLRSVISLRPVELDPVKRRLARAAGIADLRRLARRRLPGGVFDYIDGAAEDELSAARNVAAFSDWEFAPRVLRDVGNLEIAGSLFAKPLAFPLVLAPTGFSRIADPAGELAVARAAERAGLPYTLSTMSTRSIEEVAAVSGGRKWFQVYAWRDRGLVKELLARADAAGYEAVMLTVDTPVLGRRERDLRRGFTLPPKIGLDTLLDGALHPAWTLDLLRSEPITFANVRGAAVGDGTSAVHLADYINSQFDPALSWRDVEWLRGEWRGPVMLKGVQGVADAREARAAGVDAIALSNHGGRQLDGSPAILSLVAPVAEALGGELPLLLDGGVRRGSDIVKALCLGASACMAGRAYLYGLGAGGERGVDRALALLREQFTRTLALLGCPSVGELGPEYLRKR
ncbi:MAG TPA: alpha-hydroxy acid oxidase [Acidimicrobiales bacterium]|nr:alpha-hydroxy acid oxidase [Acidimicrobiales bacterium]